MAYDILYPLAEKKATNMGERNVVKVSVSYVKGRGCQMYVTTVASKSGGWFSWAPFTDPNDRTIIEPMARDNKKKIAANAEGVKLMLTNKSGTAWDFLKAFADKNGLKLADTIKAERLPVTDA